VPQVYFRKFITRGVYANFRAYRRVIGAAMRNTVAPGIAKECVNVIKHWKKKPDWKVTYSIDADGITVVVDPDGPVAVIWKYHVEGVPRRIIQPRRHRQPIRTTGRGRRLAGRARRPTKAALRFTSGKTGDVVFARRVDWPGIKARPYPQQAADAYRTTWKKVMEDANRRAVRAAQQEGK
jgi:hypothetical protein